MSLADEIYNKPTASSWNQPPKPGLVLAEVVNIKDPDKLGRVKCHELTEEKKDEDDWCYVMSPFAGKSHGIQFMPDVGDIVVLGYIGGDKHSPLVIGCIWNNKVKMPYPLKDGKNFDYTIKTPAKAEIHFSGEKGKEKIEVTTPAGTTIIMDDDKKLVNIKDKKGKNFIKMDLKGGAMSLEAEKKISIKSGNSSITLEKSGKITINGKNAITLDGAKVEAKAKNSFKASGTQAEVSAKGQLNLKSSGIANVKGKLLNLN